MPAAPKSSARNLSVQAFLQHYKGAVPLKGVIGWSLAILVGAAAVGLLLAQVLISQRQDQLIAETATRVELQAQSRAGMVDEWLKGLVRLGDNIAGADMVRMYVSELGSDAAPANASPLGDALRAQQPYMAQALADFVARNKLEGAHILTPRGEVLIGSGVLPEVVSTDKDSFVKAVAGQGVIRPLRPAATLDSSGSVVLDILRPILQVGDDASETGGKVVGVLWYSQPVGAKMADLVAASKLDRAGERTAMLQSAGPRSEAAVVGRTALAGLNETLESLQNSLDDGRALKLSVVDGLAVFATLLPIPGSPLAVLQEYKANDALAVMHLLKPGIYLLVTLAVGVLAAAMMTLTTHLLAQRNRTRVKLLGQSMEAMVRVVEARDSHLSGHHIKVARLAVAVSNHMNMTVAERATLYYAGLLSAVGRLLVPRNILVKKGALTRTERDALQGHITQAVEILSNLELDLPVAPVIAQMYERSNGRGYPKGLKGAEILPMARVLGAVDAYVALTSERAHRTALSKKAALEALDGGAFDAGVLSALMKVAK